MAAFQAAILGFKFRPSNPFLPPFWETNLHEFHGYKSKSSLFKSLDDLSYQTSLYTVWLDHDKGLLLVIWLLLLLKCLEIIVVPNEVPTK